MADSDRRETSDGVLRSKTAADANEEFSQKAAENRKPPLGMGLTEPLQERSETEKSDLRQPRAGTPQSDAAGQREDKHAGGGNDGVSSADPRVLSGKKSGDATFPLKQDEKGG